MWGAHVAGTVRSWSPTRSLRTSGRRASRPRCSTATPIATSSEVPHLTSSGMAALSMSQWRNTVAQDEVLFGSQLGRIVLSASQEEASPDAQVASTDDRGSYGELMDE